MTGLVRGPNNSATSNDVGIPPMVFFFTLDQLAGMLSIEEKTIRTSYLYYAGRTTGKHSPNLLYAVNMAADPITDPPNWRVAHTEFVRWLRRKGFRVANLQFPR